MKILWSSLFVFALSLPASAQLESKITQLQDLIQEVQVGKDVYEQMLEFDSEEPFQIHFTQVEIDKKGRTETMEYFLNLAHVEARKVRWKDGKDQIQVILDMGSKDYIKVLEDEEMDGYESEVSILALDVDNARAMVDLLKEIVPIAREAWEAGISLPADYQGLRAYVAERITNAESGDEGYEQSWTYEEEHPVRLVFAQTEMGDDERMTYHFNLADLDPRDVSIRVKGDWVQLQLSIDDNKDYVQVRENGEIDDYESDIEIAFSEIDEALQTAEALEALIPLAREAQDDFFPDEADLNTSLARLQENLQTFSLDGDTYEPEINNTCQAEYNLRQEDENLQFLFDWADMNAKSVEIEVKKEEISVEVQTKDKKDFIQAFENGEQDNYTDELAFPVPDIPSAKLLRHWIQSIINACPEETPAEDFEWLKEAVDAGAVSDEEVSQQLEQLEDDPCKWLLTIEDDKDENVYEFNLYDLNPQSIEIDIDRDAVKIQFEAINKKEIIKTYTNGEETGFTEELEFELANIRAGKAAVATLIEQIEACEQKE